jgi:hypothetical protein
VRQTGEVEVVGLLTTVTQEFVRVSMHAVREALLDQREQVVPVPLEHLHERRPLDEHRDDGSTAGTHGALEPVEERERDLTREEHQNPDLTRADLLLELLLEEVDAAIRHLGECA